MDNKSIKNIYKKYYKETGGKLNFTFSELRECLMNQGNKCAICHKNFSPYTGDPVILGNAHSAICRNCFEALRLLKFNNRNLLKADLLIKSLSYLES